ncbi:GNAT family N-acetyltransferase [Planotetraspora kaengkrachanensis]|uniref:N-acetyltransferase GCN5 n=1 Tax=Planotetraspora kaengkrachanensis TaxID=575193 RepID=A0A8J3LUH0_9ACTN|nr:GNAT family N-acetyltransferase [Planotetraspora kaengkrachanensis]GIG78987.1 N-acetyltransferase GCN5 [Planotetraspora kaengkrachanensis]
MADFSITNASAEDIRRIGGWAADEGWNPGRSDGQAFFSADPHGFFIGRLEGEAVASISAIRYGTDFGFIGLYIARPSVRGQGYGIQVWRAGMEHLAGRNIGLDGVVEQQDNYQTSGFRRAWNNLRFEGVPLGADALGDVTLIDARAVPFDRIAAYDRRFFPAPRDAFLSSWIGLPDRTALAAVRDGRLHGLGVIRAAGTAPRVGPLYASSLDVAIALMNALAASVPGSPVVVDVPDINKASVQMMERLGLEPVFEAARMYTGPVPDVDLPGIYAVTSIELG